ncbi:MAG: SEL1-like repeat protein, partial [Burkholderiaceae bacterium]|nr:SEL1-like repeat protein [Burkholderiaceae bacterium]
GVPANYAEAIRLYQLAASQGSQRARHMLELIYSRPSPQGGVDIAWMQQLAALDLGPDGAVLSPPLPTAPPLFGRDPTPLYDLLPRHWRSTSRPMPPPSAGIRR